MLAKSEPSRMVEALTKTTKKGDQHMTKHDRFIGLDVHKDTIQVAVAEDGRADDGARSAKMAW